MKNPPLQQGHDGPRAPPLRPYQADTLQRMKSYEGNAALCVIATGLGKTRIFAEYIRCDVLENDHHILILSHREELVIQPLEYLKGLPCGIEQGTTHAHGEPIISASVQSLVGRLDKYNPYSIDTIIIDEAQFLTKDEVYYLVHLVDDCSIPVICYGLRADFKGDLFPGSYHLLVLV